MWRLVRAEVVGVRRAIDIELHVDAPVVALHGPTGAGKSSALLGIGWGLSGQTVTEGGRLTQDQIRNTIHNAVVDLDLVNDEGETLSIMRTLTPGSHELFVDGQQYESMGKASAALEARLGVKLDQLGYLTSAHRLVDLSGLQQADLICGLMGPDIQMIWLDNEIGDLSDMCLDLPDVTGWPLLQAALRIAESKRTEQGREAKSLRADAEKAQAVVMERCRAARVPGPPQIGGKLAQVEEMVERLRGRRAEQEQQVTAQADYDAQVANLQSALARAEAEVALVRKQIAEADAVRETREQERAAAISTLKEAEDLYAKAREAYSAAANNAQAMEVVHDMLQSNIEELEGAGKCLTCLRDVTDEVRTEVNQALAEAQKEAEEARAKAEELRAAFVASQSRCEAAREALEALPPIAPASELQAKLEAAARASDAASNGLDELDAAGRPEAPTPQEVEATKARLLEMSQQHDALMDAEAAHTTALAAAEKANAAARLYDDYGNLVVRLREIIREVAGDAIGPVLATSNEMLAPRLTLAYDAEQGIVARYSEDEQRPISELSTGERLMVGVSLQASIARALGVGICLVDDASVWDPETARATLCAMADIAEDNGLNWIMASAHDPGRWTDGNLQTVEIDGGYAV